MKVNYQKGPTLGLVVEGFTIVFLLSVWSFKIIRYEHSIVDVCKLYKISGGRAKISILRTVNKCKLLVLMIWEF